MNWERRLREMILAGGALSATACGASTEAPVDVASHESSSSDAAASGDDAADAAASSEGGMCPDPGPTGFPPLSLFADLSLALCGSANGYPNDPSESKPCEGTIMVQMSEGVDSSAWWLFDERTGELEAYGGGGAGGNGAGCVGARSGFSYPLQCNTDNGWSPWTPLVCTDDTSAGDASADAETGADVEACAPSGCTASCPSNGGTHNVSTMINGCAVWQCCVPDDAGADAATEAAADASASDAADAGGE